MQHLNVHIIHISFFPSLIRGFASISSPINTSTLCFEKGFSRLSLPYFPFMPFTCRDEKNINFLHACPHTSLNNYRQCILGERICGYDYIVTELRCDAKIDVSSSLRGFDDIRREANSHLIMPPTSQTAILCKS